MEMYRNAMSGSNLAPAEMTGEMKRTAELAKGVKNNPYLGTTREGKPGHKPRPTRDDTRFASDRDDTRLREAQASWDRAEAWAAHGDELKAARQAKEQAAKEAERQRIQAADDARTAAERAAIEDRLRRRFLATPGATEADWERAKDQQLADHFRAAAQANDETARQASAAMYRNW